MPQPVDLEQQLPDEAHEGLRQAVVQAIADLTDSFMLLDTLFALSDTARTDIGLGQADFGDSLLLVDALFDLLDQAMAHLTAAAGERDQLRADRDALTTRMAALEAALAGLLPPDATATPIPDATGGLL